MAKCSRCGIAETNLYVNGVPVCMECDNKSTSQSTSAGLRITEPNQQPPNPPRKVQSIDRSMTAEATIHVVEARHR